MGAGEEHVNELIGPPGEVLFHYTTLDTAVRFILPEGRLRLSPFSTMRDPREYQRWSPTAAGYVDGMPPEELSAHVDEASAQLNALKDRFKLLSFTMDDPTDNSVYGRGFARSRLWEIYADRGRGVCLVFDKQALVDGVVRQLEAEGLTPLADEARYANKRLFRELFVDLDELLATGVEAVVNRIATEHLGALFFTNLTDWKSEREFRVVVATDSSAPVVVGGRGALRHVIMGYECAPHFFPALKQLAHDHGYRIRRAHLVQRAAGASRSVRRLTPGL